MKKTTKGEGKLNVLRGPDAELLNQHFAKTGKYQLSDFSEDELDQFQSEMEAQKHQDEFETRDGGDTNE